MLCPRNGRGHSMSELWIVHCIDDDDGDVIEGTPRGGFKKRMAQYDDHKAYQGETADPASDKFIRKIAAGPLLSDDGTTMVGSCFILSSTREEVDRFVNNDPFYRAKVWKAVSVHRYVSIPNGIQQHP